MVRYAGVFFFLLLGASLARADNTNTNFVASRFQPVGGVEDVLAVQASRVGADAQMKTWGYFDYASGLLRLTSTFTGNEVGVLNPRVSMSLGGTYVFLEKYEVSLALPFALYQGGDTAGTISPAFAKTPPSFAFGDIVLAPKAHIYDFGNWDFGAGFRLTVPSGTHAAYMSYDGFSFQPQIMVEYANVMGVRLIGNTGVAIRPTRDFDYAPIGTAWTYGIGADWPFLWKMQDVRVQATVQGELVLDDVSQFGSPVELLLAALWRISPELNATVGIGKGLTNGYGVPLVRVLAGVSYSPILGASEPGRATPSSQPEVTPTPTPAAPAAPH